MTYFCMVWFWSRTWSNGTKTERSRRTIRLDDGLVVLLKGERERQETEQHVVQGIGLGVVVLHSLLREHALLFPASPIEPTRPRRHGPISKSLCSASGDRWVKRAALPRPSPHARYVAPAGRRARRSRERPLNAAVTLGIYSHATMDAEAAAAARLVRSYRVR
jgi:hypothetical protein